MATLYEQLAKACVAEGIETFYALLGDGNMHWATVLQQQPGVRLVHARHEHCAVVMAMGQHSADGKVALASVTCGPGFTQIMTALVSGVRQGTPMVIFAGEAPQAAQYHVQRIDQAPFARACGVPYLQVTHPGAALRTLREAFHTARHQRIPVVIGIPYDLQTREMPEVAYIPSTALGPAAVPLPPDAGQIADLAARLAAARSPLFLAGKGAVLAGAGPLITELADRSGGLLATTQAAKGLFDDHDFSLGISGGLGTPLARELWSQCDLVIAFGARMTWFTQDYGKAFHDAHVAQIDTHPLGFAQTIPVADVHLRADARLAAEALLTALPRRDPAPAGLRTPALAAALRQAHVDTEPYLIAPGTLDPRQVIARLQEVLPRDFDLVSGTGQQSYFHTALRGWRAENYHFCRDFAAVGNGLSYAIGVAAQRGHGRVILFEGDGGLLMNVQELETIGREGIPLLMLISNDGAYGSEIHKLRKDGLSDRATVFGRGDLAATARSFGLRAETITDLDQIAPLMADYAADPRPTLWNVMISDQVVNPVLRRH